MKYKATFTESYDPTDNCTTYVSRELTDKTTIAEVMRWAKGKEVTITAMEETYATTGLGVKISMDQGKDAKTVWHSNESVENKIIGFLKGKGYRIDGLRMMHPTNKYSGFNIYVFSTWKSLDAFKKVHFPEEPYNEIVDFLNSRGFGYDMENDNYHNGYMEFYPKYLRSFKSLEDFKKDNPVI